MNFKLIDKVHVIECPYCRKDLSLEQYVVCDDLTVRPGVMCHCGAILGYLKLTDKQEAPTVGWTDKWKGFFKWNSTKKS